MKRMIDPPVPVKKKKPDGPPMAGIKMDKGLFHKAKKRAKQSHQTLSEYIRQLIVRDLRA